MSLRILLVEDEPAIAELIRVNLHHAGFEVDHALSAEDASERLKHSLPDVILLDWMLPGRPGIHLARHLRQQERTRELPLILLTAKASEDDKILGLESGADDYITKPFSPRELIARIQAVVRRRQPHLGQDSLTRAGLTLNPASHEITAHGHPVHLGPTEFRLLAFLMAHPGRVYSRAQLLNEVWGDHVFVEERTVDVHVRRVRAALTPFALEELIETVRGSGYRFTPGR